MHTHAHTHMHTYTHTHMHTHTHTQMFCKEQGFNFEGSKDNISVAVRFSNSLRSDIQEAVDNGRPVMVGGLWFLSDSKMLIGLSPMYLCFTYV